MAMTAPPEPDEVFSAETPPAGAVVTWAPASALGPVPVAPRPPGELSRRGRVAVDGVRRLRRAPFTLGFIFALWIVGAATGSLSRGLDPGLLGRVGVSWEALASGRWWTPLSSVLWCQSLSAYVWVTVLLAVLVAPVEVRLGTVRTAALFVGCHITGALLGIGLIHSAQRFNASWLTALGSAAVVGPSIGAAGVILAGTAGLSALWRRRIRLIVGLALVMLVAYIGLALDVLRLCGGLVGLAIGAVALRRGSRRIAYAPSRDETRVLIALFTATVGVGLLVKCLFESFSTAIMFLVPALLLLGVAYGLRRGRRPTEDAETAAKARGILIRGGGSTLSYLTTRPGHTYWISPYEKAAVAYRVVSGIALTTGDPVGSSAARRAAIGQFDSFCRRNGWSPCFYGVTAEGLRTAQDLGWHSVEVAEDTLVPLSELAVCGELRQSVRAALSRAGRAGLTAQWWAFGDAPVSIAGQIRALSEEWITDRGLPETGFTLGGLAELDDPAVRCLVALDRHGSVHGVTSWMPVYRNGLPIGWTLDFVRHSANAFPKVTQFLIASAAVGLRDEGAQFLSLPGGPMAKVDGSEQMKELKRLPAAVVEALEPVYGFRSLQAFKATLQPTLQPLYLVCPDLAELPRIGDAIGKAYLPYATPRQTAGLLTARACRSDAHR